MKDRFLILWLAATVFLSSSDVHAKHYYFNHYSTQNGLLSNTVNSVVQDKLGFIWVSTRDGLCRFDGDRFVEIEIDINEQDRVASGESITMCVDDDGIIWFCTRNGVRSYDPVTGERKSYDMFGSGRASRIINDTRGNIWIVADNLYRYNKSDGKVKVYPREEYILPSAMVSDAIGNMMFLSDGTLYRHNNRTDSFDRLPVSGIRRMVPTLEGELLICTHDNAVKVVNPQTLATETLLEADETETWRNILCMVERIPGEYWIGTETGIYIYTKGEGITDTIQESAEDKYAISTSYVTNMFADKDGNVWAGTYYTGLNLWQDKKDSYQIYYDYKSSNSLKGNVVRPIKKDSSGHLWIGTEDGELNMYDPMTHEMVMFSQKEYLYNIHDLLPVEDEIWIGSFGSGLFRFRPDTKKMVAHYDLGTGYITKLLQTANGDILAGTRNGLFVYDKEADSFYEINSINPQFIHALYQDHAGNIWTGTQGNGIRVLDPYYNLVAKINANEENGLKSDRISSIFEDSRHRIWVTTEGGGALYSEPGARPDNVVFTMIDKSEGLPSNVACAVVEDMEGMIWISSTRGLVRFDPRTKTIISSFFGNSQITESQYSFDSRCTIPSGIIFMGTTDGIVSFTPSVIKSIIPSKHLYITDIKAISSEGSMDIHTPGHSSFTSDRIEIKSKDVSTLEFYFSVPDYSGILSVEYLYSLSRKRKEAGCGTLRTSEGKAVFTSIRPGQYVFNVRMAGCNWEGTKKRIEVKVIPPLYLSLAARVLYALLLVSLVGACIFLISRKKDNDRKRSLTRLENEKQKEIYDAKIKYFTNITHEIRTPLSLIKMPVDKILATEGYKSGAKEDMLTIKANTDRLLELTNQLLDLRKVEQKELKLIFTKEDVRKILLQTCEYFTVTAKERHIVMNVMTPDAPVNGMCAPESIKKILSNLLSNAIKYGKDKIDVILSEGNGTISIRINSNGTRIANSDRERIFEPFFQARMSDDNLQGSNGTGLGLPFAKSLAELHSGRLYLDDNVTDANSFVLEIPVEQPDAVFIKEEEVKNDSLNQIMDSSRHSILVVEDSAEMRNYIGKELSGDYNTILTSNGEEAMKVIQEQKVDLVVSDIMMPVMDGCELCNRIKTEIDYCHIPVILLTAAVGVETRIETLKVGADGYIEKPFSIDLLRANIANIFKNKEISYRQFTQSPLTHYNGVVVNSMDDDFMERLHSEVMKHLSEQDLNIEALTAILGTSKSTLYRKIKANTGLNINEYIRLCRLKEAAEMLSSQKYRINEVAYLVGFSSPSYFTTSFQKQFNISPSAFVKRIKQED